MVLPVTNRRKVGTTSSHHGPYVLGYTRATMMYTERGEAARQSEPQKVYHSTDWSLKPDSMKVESLVIAHQNGAVNTFPAPPELRTPEVGSLTARRAPPKVCSVRGVKS